jgi:hypothetical protein
MTTPKTGQPARYDICIAGHLGEHWARALGVAELTHQADGITLLRVVVADQAALHGLLQRLRDLGIPLVSVTPAAARTPD